MSACEQCSAGYTGDGELGLAYCGREEESAVCRVDNGPVGTHQRQDQVDIESRGSGTRVLDVLVRDVLVAPLQLPLRQQPT